MPNPVVNYNGGVIQADSSNTGNAIVQRDTNGDSYHRDLYITRVRPISSSSGGNFRAIVAKTANYTATSSDSVITVDATSGAVTITPDAAATAVGQTLTIVKIDSGSNNVIFDPSGSELVNGASTKSWNTQYQSFTFISNGTAWYTI